MEETGTGCNLDRDARMKVWTLEIAGGNPFRIDVPNHPPLEHDGNKTIWKTNLEVSYVQQIDGIARSQGAGVKIHTENDEAKNEVLQQAQELAVKGWLTAQCPLCYFCDLTTPNKCGRQDWHPQVLATAMQLEKAKISLAQCPRNKK